MQTAVIIVAAGSGSRMGADLPKQFLKIAGRTILVRTLEKFAKALPESNKIVVLSEDMLPLWQEVLIQENCTIEHKVCFGGSERFFSVQNALEEVGNVDLVAVHDGVRPFLSCDMICACVQEASVKGAVVPVVEAVDSFRMLTPEGSHSVLRSSLRAVQTPQVFDVNLLKQAYGQIYDPMFTDDASVVESLGVKIHLCAGERENIKITSPMDLVLAEVLVADKNQKKLVPKD